MSKQTTKSGLKPNHKKVISIIIGVVVVAAPRLQPKRQRRILDI